MDHFVEVDVSWLETVVAVSMEHGSRQTVEILWMLHIEGTVLVLRFVNPCIKVGVTGEHLSPWILPSGLVIILG